MSAEREKVLVEHPFDWARVEGCTLMEAARYLLALAPTLPVDARIDEHWTGYEVMKIRVISYRDETDPEMDRRLEAERISREATIKRLENERARNERRLKYLELKKEFG